MSYKRFSRHGGFSHAKTPYRSGLEDDLAEQLKHKGVKVTYESYSITYKIPEKDHVYTPDFVLPNGIIIEGKGIFDTQDRKKHLFIKAQYPNLDIRFVFSNSNAKIRKGSKTSYGAWCKKYGFRYADKFIPEAWFYEDKKNMKGLLKKIKKV